MSQFNNKYAITVAIRAMQDVSLDTQDETFQYGSVSEIYENEYVHIQDTTNNCFVSQIQWSGDEDSMYQEIIETIETYENNQ